MLQHLLASVFPALVIQREDVSLGTCVPAQPSWWNGVTVDLQGPSRGGGGLSVRAPHEEAEDGTIAGGHISEVCPQADDGQVLSHRMSPFRGEIISGSPTFIPE